MKMDDPKDLKEFEPMPTDKSDRALKMLRGLFSQSCPACGGKVVTIHEWLYYDCEECGELWR